MPHILSTTTNMNVLKQCSDEIYVGCRFLLFMQHALWNMSIPRYVLLKFVYFLLIWKKNSYLRLFKQNVSACFISRQFIQGWLVTVRNACVWIKLYLIFGNISGKFPECSHQPLTYKICRCFAIIRKSIFTTLILKSISRKYKNSELPFGHLGYLTHI